LLCRPLTLRAFDRRFAAARKTSRFVALVKILKRNFKKREQILKAEF